METETHERPAPRILSLFVGVGAGVASLLLILVVLVILAVGTYQQALKADRRDRETALILQEIRHLQVLYAQQNARREVRSEKAVASAEKAVARVSQKADRFAAILKQSPKRTVVVQRVPVVVRPRVRARPRNRASRPKRRRSGSHSYGQAVQRWEGYWDGTKWIGGWK